MMPIPPIYLDSIFAKLHPALAKIKLARLIQLCSCKIQQPSTQNSDECFVESSKFVASTKQQVESSEYQGSRSKQQDFSYLIFTCYLLLATCYQLLATCYLLLTSFCLLLALCFLLLASCSLLLTSSFLLLVTRYLNLLLVILHVTFFVTFYFLLASCFL